MPWVEKQAQGCRYFYDTDTGHASIAVPEGFVASNAEEEAGLDALVAAAADSQDWEVRSAPSGRVYFVNAKLRQATWSLKRVLQGGGAAAAAAADGNSAPQAAPPPHPRRTSAAPTGSPRNATPSPAGSPTPSGRVGVGGASHSPLSVEDHFAVSVLEAQSRRDRQRATYMQRELGYLLEVAPGWVLDKEPSERQACLQEAVEEMDAIRDSIEAHGLLPRRRPLSPPPPQSDQPYAHPRIFPGLGGGGGSPGGGGVQRSVSPSRTQSRRLLHAAEELPPCARAAPAGGGQEGVFQQGGGEQPSSHLPGWSKVEEDAWQQLAALRLTPEGL